MPIFTGVTRPVVEPTVATDELELVQIPPVSELVRVMVVNMQMAEGPEIVGTALTVNVLVT